MFDATPNLFIHVPHYPIIKGELLKSLAIHPAYMAGLGGDHDGDMSTKIGVMSEDANEECRAYIVSKHNLVSDSGKLAIGSPTAMTKLTFYNMTMDPV